MKSTASAMALPPASATTSATGAASTQYAAVAFIVLWSTGYVAGKLALPHVGPLTLVFLRFGLAAAILLVVALLTRAPWPASGRQWAHIAVVGVLLQAVQFSGLYTGMMLGVSAGVSAVIVGLMPIFTAVGAVVFLAERITLRQVAGLTLGLAGVALVVAHKLRIDAAGVTGHVALGLALLGITAGTLYQKKFCADMDLRTGGCIQLGVAALLVGPVAHGTEGLAAQWTPALLGSMLWMAVVNSMGASSIMFLMLRRGEASRVASLFYLIPAVTAVMGYLVLAETLSLLQLLGFLVSAAGVYLATRKRA